MQNLLPTLLDYDPGLLVIIAHRWDVDLEINDRRDTAQVLAEAMLEPARAAVEWNRLSDPERGALQTLLGAPQHKMPEVQFSRLFGEIRQMGPGRREREKPHLNPVSIAETLYYRGLLSIAFHQGSAGGQTFVFVPSDLAAVLPVHETGFDLESLPDTGETLEPRSGIEPAQVTPATTTLVDDMTTLLAHLQIARVPAQPGARLHHVIEALAPYWLGTHSPASVALMLALSGSMGLAANEDDAFRPVPARAKRWLEQSRPRQVRALGESWRTSTLYNDLWHVPGLQPEDTGWRNDPLLARQTVFMFLEMVPEGWWPVGELIALVQADEPDFQRPGGDYDSWYIRDADTGAYLHGFENWDRVDGALLRFILTGPMHWLGLVDLGDGGALARLTLYGRALVGGVEWPDPDEEHPPAVIEDDGTIRAPRMLSRYERFQLARITEWGAPGDPYTYRLTGAGLRRAAQQDLPLGAIQAFLRRITGRDKLPPLVLEQIDRWAQTSSAEIWMERGVILRTTTPDALQPILELPELRRFIGAQLGPTAVFVRAGQEHDLAAALQQHGIAVEFDD